MKGTTTHALYFGGSNTVLWGYVVAYMVGDRDSRRSTTRYVVTVGGTPISWISKLQKVVTLSTMEEKYVVATEASKEMIGYKGSWRNWVRNRRIEGCTVTTRVSFILQRTQISILILNAYNSSTISYDLF